MTFTDLDIVCTIAGGLFFLEAIALIIYWGVYISHRPGGLAASDRHEESILVYMVSAIVLAITYIASSDYVGSGKAYYTSPCNSDRTTVIWGWVLGDVIAYSLWNWPMLNYIGALKDFDLITSTAIVALAFVFFVAAALSKCYEWIAGSIGIVLLLVYAFLLVFWRKIPNNSRVAMRITVFIVIAIKIGAIVTSSVLAASLRSLATDAILNLIPDLLLWGVFAPILLAQTHENAGKDLSDVE
jgi:hypothetical protein